MRLNTPIKSLTTVVFRSANKEKIRQAVHAFAAELRVKHPEIRRIIWFGSWVTGRPLPYSDVDICIILTRSDKTMRDRIPDYLPFGFPVGIDLFPYTENEFRELAKQHPSWYNAIRTGIEV